MVYTWVNGALHIKNCKNYKKVKINSIVKAISPGVECSLYIDDFLICYRSKHIHIIERHLQQCLNKLADWADTNGLKFSPSKTVCIHFCKLCKPHPEPTLLLNGTPVPVVEETKFLGVIFDRKLSFISSAYNIMTKYGLFPLQLYIPSTSVHFLLLLLLLVAILRNKEQQQE